MNVLLILVCGGVLLIIIGIVMGRVQTTKAVAKQKANLIFDKYSEHGKVWIRKMWDMYMNGETWDKDYYVKYDEYEKMFGITLAPNKYGVKVTSYWKDMGIPDNYSDLPENTIGYQIGSFHFDLDLYLGIRYNYQYKPLLVKDNVAVMKEYGLNIDANEILYFNQNKVDWYEQETISTNVSYSGFKYRSGGRMSFNTGTFNVIRNSAKGFVLLDRGHLYITNKRIIFVGNTSMQNRSIPFSNILEYDLFKDGILVGKENGKKPLIFFPEAVNSLIPMDGLNQCIRVLDRILSDNETQDLTPESFKSV